jgi:hypothetical protein
MAALDFPAAPSVNDTYSANGRTWTWNGESWRATDVGGVETDPYFSSVLLLTQRGNGSGAILGDDSPSHREISGERIRYADSNDWNFTGNFTVEVAEVVYTSTPAAVVSGLFGHYLATGNQRSWAVWWDPANAGLASTVSTNGNANLALTADVWTPTLGVQYDITLERSGTTVRLYRDGTVIDSGTLAGTLFNSTDPFYLTIFNQSGTLRPHLGTIGGCRITTVARYGGAHTPDPFPWPTQ